MDFSQIALLFAVAAVFGIFAKFLNQPLFIGYLFAGIFLSTFGLVSDTHFLKETSHIGVALLLFLMGLEMNLRDISEVGKPAVITGILQIVLTFVLGLFLTLVLGHGLTQSVYLAIALTFSSTIIAIRLLSDKKDLGSLYGRITIAILLIQDFAALLILLFLSGLGSGEVNLTNYLYTFLKGGLVIFFVWILSKKFLPLLFDKIAAGSNELVFIISISWALGISALLGNFAGFNLETGGFLAGLALSGLPEHLQIANKTKPLRDFFLTIFFLILGSNILVNRELLTILPQAILLSLFVIAAHILIVMGTMGFLGYKKRTSFLVGITGSQVSEFALIIAAVGLGLGHIDSYYLSLIGLTAVITMVASTYLINSENRIYQLFKKRMAIFERSKTKEHTFLPQEKMTNHIVLIGCDRAGRLITNYLLKKRIPFLVVDFNPKVFRELTAKNVPVIFGDVNDYEILEMANIEEADLIISTISNLNDNINFLDYLKKANKMPRTIFTSSSKADGIKLYEKGANYVIVPEMVAGDYIKNLIHIYGLKDNKLEKAGKNHFKRMLFV